MFTDQDDTDLNKGIAGAYLYVCSGGLELAPVNPNTWEAPEGWFSTYDYETAQHRVRGDLNQGAGVAYLYTCVRYR